MIKYFAVQPNFEYREYVSLETAISATDFLVITNSIPSTKPGQPYELLFHNNGLPSPIYEYNGWKYEYIKAWHKTGNGTGYGIRVKIIDPTGEVKEINLQLGKLTNYFDNWIRAFLNNGIEIFRKYSSERDLRTVELLEENEKLKKEIAELRKIKTV